MNFRIAIFIIFFINCCIKTPAQSNYSIIVAGHTYGSHNGGNIGLHPPFINKMEAVSDTSIKFMILTGDIVNQSNEESWLQVEKELDKIGIPTYYVMGNHDENSIGHDVFTEKHGGTFYSFKHQSELFIVLNSTLQQRSISDEQITFLSNELGKMESNIKNVFVFFHEILWNSHEKYKDVLSNSRSRYDQISIYSNYWNDVHPLLQSTGKKVYVIAGDVAGNADAIPAFYDVWDNVTLIASGMGEVAEENYLNVNIKEDTVLFELVGLQDDVQIQAIQFYSLTQQPDTIYGQQLIDAAGLSQTYWVNDVLNADSYLWELSDGIEGSSSNGSIDVFFDEAFSKGTIGVQAFHSGFGYSEIRSIIVNADTENTLLEMPDNSKKVQLKWHQSGNKVHVKIEGEIFSDFQLSLYDLNGNCLQSKFCELGKNIETSFNKTSLSSNIYLLELTGKEKHLVSKINLK